MANNTYDIRTADGKLFCKCTNEDGDIRLIGKCCSMTLQELLQKIYVPVKRTGA